MNIMKLIKDLGQLLLLSGRFLLFSAKKQLERKKISKPEKSSESESPILG